MPTKMKLTFGSQERCMTILKTETFNLKVPENFTRHWAECEIAFAEADQAEHTLQAPELRIALSGPDVLDDYEGNDVVRRLENSLLDFGKDLVDIQVREVTMSSGTSQVVSGRVHWAWDQKAAEVCCVLGVWQLEPEVWLTLRAFLEVSSIEPYLEQILAVWASTEIHGDAAGALLAKKTAQDSQRLKIDTDERPNEVFVVPEDGQERFSLHGLNLGFSPKTRVQTTKLGKDLEVELFAKPNAKLRKVEGLLDSPDSKAPVGFRLTVSTICQGGVPQGEFRFVDGKSENHDIYLWDDGFDYPLEFNGLVEFKQGWVGLVGVLKPSWDRNPQFRIEIAKKIDVAKLNWSNYRFKSLQEIEGIDPQSVRYLELSNPDFRVLPPQITSLTGLRSLTIHRINPDWNDNSPGPQLELTEQLSRLTKLDYLSIFGFSLAPLPDSIGKLKNLNSLHLSNCSLSSTPNSLWQLPKLSLLALDRNQLRELPESIQLKQLTSLDLSDNLLPTLPAQLGELPLLGSLKLKGNPLSQLPVSFKTVAEVDLSIEEKIRLLDFHYQGADGRGLTPWDDSHFECETREAKLLALPASLQKSLKAEQLEALLFLVKKEIFLCHHQAETYENTGNTRFGGWPDLPKSWTYPRWEQQEDGQSVSYCMEFIAQLNCAELASYQSFLPRQGILYFFLSSVQEFQARALYASEALCRELCSGKSLNFESGDFYDFAEPPYEAFNITVEARATLPNFYSASSNSYRFRERSSPLGDQPEILEQIDDQLSDQEKISSHSLNAHVFTQNESPEHQAALAFGGYPQDWVVLLKVASLGSFQWWDAGELFFVIHKSDLAKGDFSNVFCSLESS